MSMVKFSDRVEQIENIHKILRSGAFSGTSAMFDFQASLRSRACCSNSKETWREKARVIFCLAFPLYLNEINILNVAFIYLSHLLIEKKAF